MEKSSPSRTTPAANVARLRIAKQHGFSDVEIARLWGTTEQEVWKLREAVSLPEYKMIDSCAGSKDAYVPYYSTFDGSETKKTRDSEEEKAVFSAQVH